MFSKILQVASDSLLDLYDHLQRIAIINNISMCFAELERSLPAALKHFVSRCFKAPEFEWQLRGAWQLPSNKKSRIVLVIPSERVLIQKISLPTLSRRQLRSMLSIESDKYTPYRPGTASHTYKVIKRDRENQASEILLVSIPVPQLSRIIEETQSLGGHVISLDIRDTDGKRLKINLIPQATELGVRDLLHRLLPVFLCAGVLMINMWIWIDFEEKKVSLMHDHVKNMSFTYQQILEKIEKIRELDDSLLVLQGLNKAHTTVLSVLTEVTNCLPKDTWLESVTVESGKTIAMRGTTNSPDNLQTSLKKCKRLHEPKYQGTIQPSSTSRDYKFKLAADLKGNPDED